MREHIILEAVGLLYELRNRKQSLRGKYKAKAWRKKKRECVERTRRRRGMREKERETKTDANVY